MSNTLEYILSLNDQMSGKLQKIGITSDTALNKFAALQRQSVASDKVMKDMGRSVGSLQEKLATLKAERDWIPSKNIDDIRKYNHEIKALEKEVTKLQTINGSEFKRNLGDAINSLPGAALITNPVAQAGAALYGAGKMAMSFDEGMAKINTTAQLTPKELEKLKSGLIDIGTSARADLSKVPEAYEKILSQTGDVALSTDILGASLKGSKAGFTDVSVVSGALAQTLSLVGKENTNAQEVLDTLFAAKRVGAGEFKDFAGYVPNLVASGAALGKGFKETAGLFAYMTGKGLSAEKSATLLENAFTALGKSDITSGLKAQGIDVFNADGSMKRADILFGALQQKLAQFGNDDQAKSNFLEKVGLKDAQAKAAFMVLSSDGAKLSQTLNDVANASGETDKAFKLSTNPMQRIEGLWSQVQKLAITFGGIITMVLVPAMDGLFYILIPVVDTLSWLFTKITEGNPLIIGFAVTIGLLALAYNAQAIALKIAEFWGKRKLITDGLLAIQSKAVAVATGVWTGAQWLLNAAMTANPIGLIIAAIALVIAAIVVAVTHFESFGATMLLIMGPIGWLVNSFMVLKNNWDSIVQAFQGDGIIGGLKRIGVVLLDTFLYPVQQLLELLAKIPFMEGIASNGAEKIANLRKSLDLNTPVAEAVAQSGAPDGISAPDIPGITPPGGATTDPTSPTKPTTDAVASGGTRNTQITINLGKMVENVVFNGGVKENAQELTRQIEEALMQVLYAAQSAG